MRTRFWLAVWLLGILFPAAWLGRFSTIYRNAFNAVFAPQWVHILMHALLFAVLVGLGLAAFDRAAVFNRPRRLVVIFAVLGLVLLVGMLQEIFQGWSQGSFVANFWGAARAALFDLGVDLAGGAFGLLAVAAFPKR